VVGDRRGVYWTDQWGGDWTIADASVSQLFTGKRRSTGSQHADSPGNALGSRGGKECSGTRRNTRCVATTGARPLKRNDLSDPHSRQRHRCCPALYGRRFRPSCQGGGHCGERLEPWIDAAGNAKSNGGHHMEDDGFVAVCRPLARAIHGDHYGRRANGWAGPSSSSRCGRRFARYAVGKPISLILIPS